MSRTPADPNSSFPRWVALASLGVVLWLFFANAVPAVREQAELDALGQDLDRLRQQYEAAIAEVRLGSGANAKHDLQGLLVAIDRMDLTPAELCALHPQAQPPGTQNPHPENGPAGPTLADHPGTAAPATGTRTRFQ